VVKAASGTESAGAARKVVPNADANAHRRIWSVLAQKYFVGLGRIAPAKKSARYVQK
jgi:hypothetical protein